MRSIMSIPDNELFSKTNPTGEIRLDTMNRVGKFKDGRTRPVVASFVTKTGRNIVFTKKYTSTLKDRSKIRIAEHFPAIVRERRQAQIETLSTLRNANKKTNTKVIMAKDKIIINGTQKNTEAFECNPLGNTSPLSIGYNKLYHSDIITDKESHFQAHFLSVLTKDQAIAAQNAISRILS